MERGIILWLTYIATDAVVNWYLIHEKTIYPNHLLLTIIRWWMMILIGITVPITGGTLFPWLLFTTSTFWTIFDPLLNKLRKRQFFYIGENSTIDRFGKRNPKLYWLLKALVLIAGTITGYQLWNGQ